jgi:hypothetical protein
LLSQSSSRDTEESAHSSIKKEEDEFDQKKQPGNKIDSAVIIRLLSK